MRKQYKLIDKYSGRYFPFNKIQDSVEDCIKVAEDYHLVDYIIVEREVTEWRTVKES